MDRDVLVLSPAAAAAAPPPRAVLPKLTTSNLLKDIEVIREVQPDFQPQQAADESSSSSSPTLAKVEQCCESMQHQHGRLSTWLAAAVTRMLLHDHQCTNSVYILPAIEQTELMLKSFQQFSKPLRDDASQTPHSDQGRFRSHAIKGKPLIAKEWIYFTDLNLQPIDITRERLGVATEKQSNWNRLMQITHKHIVVPLFIPGAASHWVLLFIENIASLVKDPQDWDDDALRVYVFDSLMPPSAAANDRQMHREGEGLRGRRVNGLSPGGYAPQLRDQREEAKQQGNDTRLAILDRVEAMLWYLAVRLMRSREFNAYRQVVCEPCKLEYESRLKLLRDYQLRVGGRDQRYALIKAQIRKKYDEVEERYYERWYDWYRQRTVNHIHFVSRDSMPQQVDGSSCGWYMLFAMQRVMQSIQGQDQARARDPRTVFSVASATLANDLPVARQVIFNWRRRDLPRQLRAAAESHTLMTQWIKTMKQQQPQDDEQHEADMLVELHSAAKDSGCSLENILKAYITTSHAQKRKRASSSSNGDSESKRMRRVVLDSMLQQCSSSASAVVSSIRDLMNVIDSIESK